MKITFCPVAAAVLLAGCNSISINPGTMEPGATVFADRGGFTMRRSIKTELEQRGYKVLVGTAQSNRGGHDSEGTDIDIGYTRIPKNTKYYVKVSERREYIRPIWCALNGFWWWNFNVSIADQETGTEIMTWRGRGCADSSMRLLRRSLNKLETKE